MNKATFSLKFGEGTYLTTEQGHAKFQLNLRQILGERLFHDYKQYNIVMDNAQMGPRDNVTSGVPTHFKIASINLFSNTLDFVNSWFYTTTGYQKRFCCGFLQWETYTRAGTPLLGTSQYFQNNGVSAGMFERPASENIDLTIQLRTIFGDGPYVLTSQPLHIDDVVFTFSIYPIL